MKTCKNSNPPALTADEFFRRGKKSSFFKEVTSEIKKERKGRILDEDRIMRDREWNELADKIVGSER